MCLLPPTRLLLEKVSYNLRVPKIEILLINFISFPKNDGKNQIHFSEKLNFLKEFMRKVVDVETSTQFLSQLNLSTNTSRN